MMHVYERLSARHTPDTITIWHNSDSFTEAGKRVTLQKPTVLHQSYDAQQN